MGWFQPPIGVFRGCIRVANLIFYEKSTWCDAFCCRHINFKTVFQSASRHAIFIQEIGKFSEDRHSPLPRPTSSGRGIPTPARRLDPRAFGAQPLPPFQNPKYMPLQPLHELGRVQFSLLVGWVGYVKSTVYKSNNSKTEFSDSSVTLYILIPINRFIIDMRGIERILISLTTVLLFI